MKTSRQNRTKMLLLLCTVFMLLLQVDGQVDGTATNIVDLTRDLPVSPTAGNNPGATALEQACAGDPLIRTCLVLEQGEIVAEYVRDGVDTSQPWDAWSVTKSWVSLLIGHIVEAGLLSVDETLFEIWSDDEVWAEVPDTEFRQNITIKELLTMSSGLINDDNNEGMFGPGGNAGGATLEDSLAFSPTIGPQGVFVYVGVLNILSYVIQERTGQTPREYANETLFPSLGIDDSEIEWWTNEEGVEYAFHGLRLTSKQMAKFGQLCLQKGVVNEEGEVFVSEWVDESVEPHVDFVQDFEGFQIPGSYGYLFWIVNGIWIGQLQNADQNNFYCALGVGGQTICVHPELNRVAVQQRDWQTFTENGLTVATVAFDSDVSFANASPPTNAPGGLTPSVDPATETPTPSPSSASTEVGLRRSVITLLALFASACLI